MGALHAICYLTALSNVKSYLSPEKLVIPRDLEHLFLVVLILNHKDLDTFPDSRHSGRGTGILKQLASDFQLTVIFKLQLGWQLGRVIAKGLESIYYSIYLNG